LPKAPPSGDVPGLLRWQSAACGKVTPLYQRLLADAADDAAAGGPTAALLAPYADRPMATAPALRLMGAVHRLVLAGELPELAKFYPSAGGNEPPEGAWPLFRAALCERGDEITALLREPVQTNETGRAAVLYAGLITLAHRFGLPIRLLEIGASAGLNLRADRFGYRTSAGVYGDPESPLVLDEPWLGTPAAPLATPVRVVDRRGCDPLPVDVTRAEDRVRLESLVWADQLDRLARLRAAIEVAERVPAGVDKADDTAGWLADRLAETEPGTLTLVWHSVMRQYVESDAWNAVTTLLAEVGEHASSDSPLAVLAFEPELDDLNKPRFAAWLTTWPGGPAELLGLSVGHGTPFEWHTAK
jgi:hypothetical protein